MSIEADSVKDIGAWTSSKANDIADVILIGIVIAFVAVITTLVVSLLKKGD
jgi:hypothetical protein